MWKLGSGFQNNQFTLTLHDCMLLGCCWCMPIEMEPADRRWRFVFERLRMWLRCQSCVCVESWLGTLRIRTAPQRSAWARRIPAESSSASQRGRFDTRNPRRRFVGHVTNSHGATARALGRAGSLQRVRRALFKFARRHREGA